MQRILSISRKKSEVSTAFGLDCARPDMGVELFWSRVATHGAFNETVVSFSSNARPGLDCARPDIGLELLRSVLSKNCHLERSREVKKY